MSTAPVDQLLEQFSARFGDTEDVRVACAPGRVNLLGDHTDYNDGFVLPMTIDHAVRLALRKRPDHTVRLYSTNFDEAVSYPLTTRPDVPRAAWSSYVTGAIEELRERGLVSVGFEGVISGDVPLGAGLSSSAAVSVATVVALQHLFEFDLEPVESIKLCQRVEHRYVGLQCGIMDQFVVRLGRSNHALFLDCRSLEHEHIPLPLDQVRIVIVHSGVKRELADSKYNERRDECRQGVEHFRQFDAGVNSLRDVSAELLERHQHGLLETIRKRCQHVVQENQRVLDATEALRNRRLAAFGQLMNESHASLRDLYQVSCPQLDALVDIGQGTDGVLGARMTGAGFGGCTVHLVEKDGVGALQDRIRALYPKRFGLEPSIYVLEHNLEAGPLT